MFPPMTPTTERIRIQNETGQRMEAAPAPFPRIRLLSGLRALFAGLRRIERPRMPTLPSVRRNMYRENM
jgi:hypothetical protein